MPWGPEAAGEQPVAPADAPEGIQLVQTPSQTVNMSYIPCIHLHTTYTFTICQMFSSIF